MTDTIKILGQSNPSAATLTVAYTVPANTSAVISSMWICETGGGTPTFRLAILSKGAEVATQSYVFFDKALVANQTIVAPGGITLGQGDEVSVYASDGNVAFSVFGVETTKAEQ